MKRILIKEIIKRSRLRNKFLKSKCEADKKKLRQTKKLLCVST